MKQHFQINQKAMPWRKRVERAMLKAANAMAKAIAWKKPRTNVPEISAIKKILLCNGGHFGDLLLVKSIIPMILENYPDAEIGVVVGSWGLPIIGNHPEVRYVHVVDHFMRNRSNLTHANKLLRYLRTRKTALREMRLINYDVAVDTYYFVPNNQWLIWQSGIPVRIGYDAGGFPALLTCAVHWENKNQHVLDYHIDLLRRLPGSWPDCADSYSIRGDYLSENEKQLVLRKHKLEKEDYVVVHPGTGAQWREWPIANWQELVRLLVSKNERVVITGQGSREANIAAEIAAGTSYLLRNLCNVLDMDSFTAVVENAKIVIAVESFASHLSAAVGARTIVIFGGQTNPYHWSPMGKRVIVIRKSLYCSPCYRRRGCESMECIRTVSVEDVENALQCLSRKR